MGTKGCEGDILEVVVRAIGAFEGGDEGASACGSDCNLLFKALGHLRMVHSLALSSAEAMPSLLTSW